MTAGRVLRISAPRVGLKLTSQISPRSGDGALLKEIPSLPLGTLGIRQISFSQAIGLAHQQLASLLDGHLKDLPPAQRTSRRRACVAPQPHAHLGALGQDDGLVQRDLPILDVPAIGVDRLHQWILPRTCDRVTTIPVSGLGRG